MNPSARKTFPNNDSLSFRLHEQARRERSRALGDLFAKLIERVSLPLPEQLQIARWG